MFRGVKHNHIEECSDNMVGISLLLMKLDIIVGVKAIKLLTETGCRREVDEGAR